jgi:thioredoxin-related protein
LDGTERPGRGIVSVVKRILFFLLLISAGSLVGCSGDDDLKVDMTKTVTDTNAPPVNLSTEIARAKSENKNLLLEFGSSDACPPCILMQQKVFSTPEFQAFAKTNLDFVRLDFPLKVDLRPDTVATNELLSQQFDALGFPTFIALNKDGKEFWRMPGKNEDGIDVRIFDPTYFIDLLKGVEKNEQ